jgi:hypothetical protein
MDIKAIQKPCHTVEKTPGSPTFSREQTASPYSLPCSSLQLLTPSNRRTKCYSVLKSHIGTSILGHPFCFCLLEKAEGGLNGK